MYFIEQDQELILAEIKYLPMILNGIDQNKYLESKTKTLIEALCILLYDNTVSNHEFSTEENLKREKIASIVRPELIKRKSRIKETGDWIMEYIQEVVFPQIGIEN